ncbi:hypothetical protein DM02DRAFT_676745 [Periconia macrospinosa]|uniref:Uncharacterized protein n=1 Tax=Periconia macrospinosa TaxID=97972 RepID=A0A2V1D6B0_9PLEO|nr:hypothetical protein DM02DRAFT_676745 [Periconia macrospinosa]
MSGSNQITIYHIYPHENRKKHHKHIQSEVDFSKESPRGAAKRELRKKKQKTESVAVEQSEDDDKAFFLHKPYLAFHSPPKVLYNGPDKKAKPVVLIHAGSFWREYKLQYGDSLAARNVIDPRGVVKWKHNGGTKEELKLDDRKLKGYKVRTRRFWGEQGKTYVRQVQTNRQNGTGDDPNVVVGGSGNEGQQIAKAEGVVYLRWERPFSLKTRQYKFTYADVEFRWKGTKSVRKSGLFGVFMRYTQLKLEAQLPATISGKEAGTSVCLGKYISSVSKQKHGRLELYGEAISNLRDHITRLAMKNGVNENQTEKGKSLRDTELYQLIIATAMCMIQSEKQKRAAAGKWIKDALEGGGDGGGE